MGEFLFSLCTIYFFGGGFRETEERGQGQAAGRRWLHQDEAHPKCAVPACHASRRQQAPSTEREEETASSSSCDGTVISKLFEFMHENFHIHIHHAVRLLESISSSKESAQKNARFRGTSRTRTSISSPVIINASRVVGGF